MSQQTFDGLAIWGHTRSKAEELRANSKLRVQKYRESGNPNDLEMQPEQEDILYLSYAPLRLAA